MRVSVGLKVKLRFAVIGDVEPKPDPVFENFRRTVEIINELHRAAPIAFTAGIGDLAHGGKVEQYEAATQILKGLETPFYTIMGNEELSGGGERYFAYAAQWNDDPEEIPGHSFVKGFPTGADAAPELLFLFATAQAGGITYDEAEIAWIEGRLNQFPEAKAFLFTHAPMRGLFPEAGERTMKNDLFQRVVARPNVTAVFSGHTHMDLDEATSHVTDRYGVRHIHLPGVERTKVGSRHTPRFRLVTIDESGDVIVETCNVLTGAFEARHALRFSLAERERGTL